MLYMCDFFRFETVIIIKEDCLPVDIGQALYGVEQDMIQENAKNLELCKKYGCEYILIDREYSTEIKIE